MSQDFAASLIGECGHYSDRIKATCSPGDVNGLEQKARKFKQTCFHKAFQSCEI